MPGIYWYLALAVLGLGTAGFIIIREKDALKLFSFFLFAALLADSGEVLIMVLLRSYTYKLSIVADPMVQNILGHVIPNSTLWPATAVLVVAHKLRLRWILLIAAFYMFLDVLFSWLGIYEHYWWKTYITGIAIFIFCYLAKWWYSRLEDERFHFLRFYTFSSIFCMIALTPAVFALTSGKVFCRIGFFINVYRDSVVSLYLITMALSLAGSYCICVLKKWYWKLVPFVLFAAADVILYKTGVMYFGGGWNVCYIILLNTFCVLLFLLLERKYSYRR